MKAGWGDGSRDFPGTIKNYLFTYCDKKSGITFLVDTGATVSVFPVSQAEVSSRKENSRPSHRGQWHTNLFVWSP